MVNAGDDVMVGRAEVTLFLATTLATAFPVIGAPASAQATTPVGAATDADGMEIVVTARKRDESLQDVPVSISVITAAAIAIAGTASLLQIEAISPGLNLTKAPTGNEVGVTIRGLGSAPGDAAFDNSVSLFVDGVYAPRSREFAASLFDVQRIEVIKGTQAALLGKNTSLGAINVITRKPGDKFAADLRASYEFELRSRLVAGGFDLPAGDTLRFRIAGQSTFDGGWVRDQVTGRRAQRTYDDAFRIVGVWEPTPALDITAAYTHDVSRNRGTPAELIGLNPVANLLQGIAGAPGTLDFTLDRRNATFVGGPGGEQFERLRVDRGSITGNLKLGNHLLTSVTGYSTFRNTNLSEADFVAGDYLERGVDEESRQFSQEIRVVSPSGGSLDYVFGGVFIDNDLSNATINTARYPFGPPASPTTPIAGSFRTTFVQSSRTISGFAQATLKVGERVRLLGGLRYTNEKKTADLARAILTPGLFSVIIYPPYAPFRLRREENNIDYSIGAQLDLNDNIMAFASYGQGTKAGGFASSVTQLDQAPYREERARTVEVGIKAQDPSRRWTLNASLFETRVANFQTVTFNGLAFIVTNTDLRSRGFEVEAAWRPVTPLRLYANTTYADAKDRRTGGPIPLAPKWSGSAGFAGRIELTGGVDALLDGSVNFRSKRFYQQDPTAVPAGDAFTTLNASVAIASRDDRYELRLIGRNIANANAAAFVFPTPIIGGASAVSERPRTIALQGSVRF